MLMNGRNQHKIIKLLSSNEKYLKKKPLPKSKQVISSYSNKNCLPIRSFRGFPGGAGGEGPACQGRRCEMQFRSLGREDALKVGMATPSSILAWRILWTEEPGSLHPIGLHRVGHD